jgi:hypothetical protein
MNKTQPTSPAMTLNALCDTKLNTISDARSAKDNTLGNRSEIAECIRLSAAITRSHILCIVRLKRLILTRLRAIVPKLGGEAITPA